MVINLNEKESETDGGVQPPNEEKEEIEEEDVWVRLRMEHGRGHSTMEETYRQFPADYDDDDLEGEAEQWAQYEMNGWTYSRYKYDYERVKRPPDEWLKKRVEECQISIINESKEADKLARLLIDPRKDYEGFKQLQTHTFSEPPKGIRIMFHPEGGLFGRTKPLTPVRIRPCAEKYGNKTLLGFLLGDFAVSIMAHVETETETLVVMGTNNPAIYVPELDKIIWGCESWWGEIKDGDELRTITDDSIAGIPYVRILKMMGGQPAEKIKSTNVTAVFGNGDKSNFVLNNPDIAQFIVIDGNEKKVYTPK